MRWWDYGKQVDSPTFHYYSARFLYLLLLSVCLHCEEAIIIIMTLIIYLSS